MLYASLRFLLIGLGCLLALGARAGDDFVVIGHANVPKIDATTLQRLYTGRAIEVAGNPVMVANLRSGSPVRERFLVQVVNMDNERYIAYWTVRRHVGKGVPPREYDSSLELSEHVRLTPGALGYIPVGDLRVGMNVVYRP